MVTYGGKERSEQSRDVFDDDVVAAAERAQNTEESQTEKKSRFPRLLKKVQEGIKKMLPPKKKPLTIEEIQEKTKRTRAEADYEEAKQDLRAQKARGPKTTIKRILSIGVAAGLATSAVIGVRSVRKAGGLSRIQGASDKAVNGVVEAVEGVGSAAEGVGAATKSTGEVVEGVSKKVASLKEDPDVLHFVERAESYPEFLWRLGLNDWNKKHPTQQITAAQLKQIIVAKNELNSEGKTVNAKAMTDLAERVCNWRPQKEATLEDIQKKTGKNPKEKEGR